MRLSNWSINGNDGYDRSRIRFNFGIVLWVMMYGMVMGLMRGVQAVDLFRISTETDQIQTLKVNDSLISTLGRYRATLTQDQCRLKI